MPRPPSKPTLISGVRCGGLTDPKKYKGKDHNTLVPFHFPIDSSYLEVDDSGGAHGIYRIRNVRNETFYS